MFFARSLLLLILAPPTLTHAGVVSTGTSDTERAGDIVMLALPITALSMSYAKDDTEGTWQYLKSGTATAAITGIVKVAVNKERPNGGDLSFPSGHSSAAFSGASFIQTRYGWKWGAPAYVAATFVAWSRVDAKKHYVEDVVAGALVALLNNHYFVTPHSNGVALNLEQKAGGYLLNARMEW